MLSYRLDRSILRVEPCRKGCRVGFTAAAGLANTLIKSSEDPPFGN